MLVGNNFLPISKLPCVYVEINKYWRLVRKLITYQIHMEKEFEYGNRELREILGNISYHVSFVYCFCFHIMQTKFTNK